MKRLAVFFGGRSAEHDVSIITGTQLIENAPKGQYELMPVYITREGRWYAGEPLKSAEFFKSFDPSTSGVEEVFLSPVRGERSLMRQARFGLKPFFTMDIAVLAMHGMHGEDGTLQGLLELADVPYTSSGVTGSAVGMDKIVMKAAFRGLGLPVLESVSVTRRQLEEDRDGAAASVEEALGYPVVVKPSNLGSSIGISKAADRASLLHALDVAAHFDRRILIERAVTSLKEINCAVAMIDGRVTPGVCERPAGVDEILSFGDKYLRGGKGGSTGMKSLSRQIPADIPDELTKRIQDLSCQAYTALDFKGVVRIDYIIDEATGDLYINEANTIPGSFAFYLFEPMGVPFAALIDALVCGAEAAYAEKNRSAYAFDSDILSKAGSGAKVRK